MKLIIKKIERSAVKPSQPEKSPAFMALAVSSCIFLAIILVLAFISVKTKYFPVFAPVSVVFIDSEKQISDQHDTPAEETAVQTKQQFETTDSLDEQIITSSSPSWSYPEINNPELRNLPELSSLLPMESNKEELDYGATSFSLIEKSQPQKTIPPPPATSHPVQLARYKHTPLPPYPKSMRLARQEGVVTLLIRVDENGLPVRVSVADSSGIPELDKTSVQWVRQKWTFYPAIQGDNYVACDIKAPLRFKLQ